MVTEFQCYLLYQVLQSETQKLYRRSAPLRIGTGGDDCSPVSELSLSATHSHSSRGSHTDSAESGIDIETPSERGSEHTPNSPTSLPNKLSKSNQLNDNITRTRHISETGSDNGTHSEMYRCATIAEVHIDCEGGEEVIEMESFTNEGFVAEVSEAVC